MTCNEIINLLPAYLDDDLPPEEMKNVERHLNSCTLCSQALDDLKMTADLLRDLPEVEPPPFFEQRIMARIRDEADQKKSIFRKIFYPLHIKIPIQAMATVLVSVLAFYVYQSGTPDIKKVAPLPMPARELKTGEQTVPTETISKTPTVRSPVALTPENHVARQKEAPYVSPPPDIMAKKEKMADAKIPLQVEPPAAPKATSPTLSAVKEEIQPPVAKGFSKDTEPVAREDSRKASDIFPREEKNDKTAGMAAGIGQSRAMKAAPSFSKSTLGTVNMPASIDVTIKVRDAAAAFEEIKRHLNQRDGRIIETQRRNNDDLLKVEVPRENIDDLLRSLEEIGTVEGPKNNFYLSDEKAVITILIVSHP